MDPYGLFMTFLACDHSRFAIAMSHHPLGGFLRVQRMASLPAQSGANWKRHAAEGVIVADCGWRLLQEMRRQLRSLKSLKVGRSSSDFNARWLRKGGYVKMFSSWCSLKIISFTHPQFAICGLPESFGLAEVKAQYYSSALEDCADTCLPLAGLKPGPR
eukprot:s33_g87.t1